MPATRLPGSPEGLMTTRFPDAGPYLRRILQSYRDQDTSELRRAISEAFDVGIPVEHLITVLAGRLVNATKENHHV